MSLDGEVPSVNFKHGYGPFNYFLFLLAYSLIYPLDAQYPACTVKASSVKPGVEPWFVIKPLSKPGWEPASSEMGQWVEYDFTSKPPVIARTAVFRNEQLDGYVTKYKVTCFDFNLREFLLINPTDSSVEFAGECASIHVIRKLNNNTKQFAICM